MVKMAKKDVAKKLEDYELTRPDQLTMFELAGLEDKKYSHTIELYDFIPKYFWGKVERINNQFLPLLEREFSCRGINYKVSIAPARIKDKDGTVKDYYPSQREELVEDALRKLASEGQSLFLDDQAGVTFTLYQLQKELESMGHCYSYAQIKEALSICVRTNIEIKTEDGSNVIDSHIFDTVGLRTLDDWMGHEKKTKAFVRFNPLVTSSIKNRSFRQLNYEKSMSYKSVVARQLHKRMSHHYTQASVMNTYQIMLSTMIRDFGLTAYQRLKDNLRDAKIALEEMKEKDVLLDYKIERT